MNTFILKDPGYDGEILCKDHVKTAQASEVDCFIHFAKYLVHINALQILTIPYYLLQLEGIEMKYRKAETHEDFINTDCGSKFITLLS